MLRSTFALVSLLAAAGSLTAQGSPAPGYRLFAPFGSLDTYLVDTNDNVVHTWRANHTPVGAYLEDTGALLRPIFTPYLPNVPSIGGVSGGVQRLAFDGSLKWQYIYANAFGWAHHDVATMPNGNILMVVWDRLTAADAFAMGRNPAYQTSNEWNPCAIIEVQQTGQFSGAIVWEWHFMDHTIQDFDPTAPNYGVVADHPELLDVNFPPEADLFGEWNHINTIDYDPVNDLIVIGSPYQNEFWIIDHSTTTAEAAGHTGGNYGKGGDFLYRWGNPQAYRAGTPADQQLFFHHGAYFIEEGLPGAGNILIFNNRVSANESTLVEVQLPPTFDPPPPGTAYGPAAPVWTYRHPSPGQFYSNIVSNAVRLPNGNTLACSGRQSGLLFEVDPAGNIVWDLKPDEVPEFPGLTFRVDYTERRLWSDGDEVSLTTGGTVRFDLCAGSDSSDKLYFVFGSASGTAPGVNFDGHQLMLNPDDYFVTTIFTANQFPYDRTAGRLDECGCGWGTFTLPGGIIPSAAAGLELNHGFVVFDPSANAVSKSSNSVPLVWAF